jgi:hypothetical protein
MSPIGTPEYNSDIYSRIIYTFDKFSDDTVSTVQVPIKQLISTEPNVCSAFGNLTIGMGKMTYNGLHSPGIAARNARTAKTPAASLAHHVRDAGMVC